MSRGCKLFCGITVGTAAVIASKWIVKTCSKAATTVKKKLKLKLKIKKKKNIKKHAASVVSHPIIDTLEAPVQPITPVPPRPSTPTTLPTPESSTSEQVSTVSALVYPISNPVKPTPLAAFISAVSHLSNSNLPAPLSTRGNGTSALLPFTIEVLHGMDHILIPNSQRGVLHFLSEEMYQAAVDLYTPVIEALLRRFPAHITFANVNYESVELVCSDTEEFLYNSWYLVYFAPPTVGVEPLKASTIELFHKFRQAMAIRKEKHNKSRGRIEEYYSERVRNALKDLGFHKNNALAAANRASSSEGSSSTNESVEAVLQRYNDLTEEILDDIPVPESPDSILDNFDTCSCASDDEDFSPVAWVPIMARSTESIDELSETDSITSECPEMESETLGSECPEMMTHSIYGLSLKDEALFVCLLPMLQKLLGEIASEKVTIRHALLGLFYSKMCAQGACMQ